MLTALPILTLNRTAPAAAAVRGAYYVRHDKEHGRRMRCITQT